MSRLIGQTVLSEIADFFRLFRTVSNDLQEHATEVERWLRSSQCTFFWVTIPEQASIEAMHSGLQALAALQYTPKAILLNRAIAHNGKPFPEVKQPNDISSDTFRGATEALKRLWTLQSARSRAHISLVEELKRSLQIDVYTTPSVRHSDNAFRIIEEVSQSMGEQQLV